MRAGEREREREGETDRESEREIGAAPLRGGQACREREREHVRGACSLSRMEEEVVAQCQYPQYAAGPFL